MRKFLVIVPIVIVLALAYPLLRPTPHPPGSSRFFSSDTYNFETVRVLNDIAAVGGDVGEVLATAEQIHDGDAESWYAAWTATADRIVALANQTQDRRAKGADLLRAQNYYRSAEFFLAPGDPRRREIFHQGVKVFYQGLDLLQVSYQRIEVPYGAHHLNATYYPGPPGTERRPLLVVVGGYDSTLEELYFSVAAAAHERGYPVLTYEGPGQGAVLRDQGLTMTPDWEKPNGAVLDQFLATHPQPSHIVLLGESLGGYLAPRAAAFDRRIDGVVAYDVFFDGYAIATRHVAPIAFWLRAHGFDDVLAFLSKRAANADPGTNWAQQNGEWVFGMSGPFQVIDNFRGYRLAPVADQITQDVLLLAGTEDHFVPIDQLEETRASLTHARSVTSRSFDRASGGSMHCQLGAPSLFYATLFDWLSAKYPQ
jgi:pimeloyl-ACP methyl ester carboxylesterase